MEMTDGSEVIARRIAAFGLNGVPDPEPFTPGPSWPALHSRIRGQRLTGLAVDSVIAGWLELSDGAVDELLAAHRTSMVWSLSVERKLLALTEAFDAEGIDFAVLKGASIAHTAYAEPCHRSFGDLDLLVGTPDYERAGRLLEALGHRRQRPEPRPGWEVRFGKARVHKDPIDGIEVDLHRTLVVGPFGLWIRPQALMERAVRFQLAGRWIPRLDDTGMLLNVAMHAVLGSYPPRLVPLRDVLQVAGSMQVDRAALTTWAGEWRLAAVLRHAFATAADVLGTQPLAESGMFTDGHESKREARALRAYLEGRSEGGRMGVSTLRAIPGLRRKVAYAGALAFPQAGFMRDRYPARSKRSYGRRLLIPARLAVRRLVNGHRLPGRPAPHR
jgi:hypothetical protein